MKISSKLFALVVVTSLVACVDVPKVEETSFETMKVKRGKEKIEYVYPAKLKGKQDVSILPQVTGTITSIVAVEGRMVRKGELLFVIDQEPFRLEVQTASANTAAAKASMESARLNYESNLQLYEKGIVSSYVMETARNEFKTAQAAVAQAQAQESQARVNLNRCSVTSPVNGIVGTINYRVGDLVSSTMAEPLTIISDNSVVVAYFSLTEADFTALTRGYDEKITNDKIEQQLSELTPIKLRLKDGSMYEYDGKMKSVAGLVDAGTGSVPCKVDFPNPNAVLRSGISGSVIYQETLPDIMTIPQTAINRLQDKSLVYVVQKDSTVKATIVEIEEINNGKIYAVTSGLKPGDEIVTKGANNLVDGQKIKIGK